MYIATLQQPYLTPTGMQLLQLLLLAELQLAIPNAYSSPLTRDYILG